MYDIVTLYLTDEMICCISTWTLSISAVIIFFFAFVVTSGAGIHSPLAVMRALQRFFYRLSRLDAHRTHADPVRRVFNLHHAVSHKARRRADARATRHVARRLDRLYPVDT